MITKPPTQNQKTDKIKTMYSLNFVFSIKVFTSKQVKLSLNNILIKFTGTQIIEIRLPFSNQDDNHTREKNEKQGEYTKKLMNCILIFNIRTFIKYD